MPQRFEPLIAAVASMVGGAITTVVAAILAMLPDLTENTSIAEPVIIGDEQMRLICIIGAVGGGVLSALIFSPPKVTGRMFAIKVGGSSLAGILFTPAFMHWRGWSTNLDSILATSAGIALVGIGAIRIAIPLWERFIGKKLSPPADDQNNPPTP